MAAVAAAAGIYYAVTASLGSSSTRSGQAHLVKATAAVGGLRPSLRPATTCRRRSITTTASKLVSRCVTVHAAQAYSSSSSSHHDMSDSNPGVTALPEEKLALLESEPAVEEGEGGFYFHRALLAAAASTTPFLLSAQDAYAAGGQYGILEGRIFSLIHPVVMLVLFVTTGYAGYLGWQWRRVRTIQDEINDLKKQVPAGAAEGQGAAPSPVDSQIKELTEVRKSLLKGGYRDRHFNFGSILLGAGVSFSVYGAVNTYLRTEKLFPGPHLYAGVGITVLWALAASLVPAMQKGNDTARSLHIALNTVNLLLFVSQIPTGWEIVLKVLEFTKFP